MKHTTLKKEVMPGYRLYRLFFSNFSKYFILAIMFAMPLRRIWISSQGVRMGVLEVFMLGVCFSLTQAVD